MILLVNTMKGSVTSLCTKFQSASMPETYQIKSDYYTSLLCISLLEYVNFT